MSFMYRLTYMEVVQLIYTVKIMKMCGEHTAKGTNDISIGEL